MSLISRIHTLVKGNQHQALKESTHCGYVRENSIYYLSLLRECIIAGNLASGKHIHGFLIKHAIPSILVVNTLIDMYCKCGDIGCARHVFDRTSMQNVYTWTIMITGYAQHGDGAEALMLFRKMQQEGVTQSRVTFVNVLSACSVVVAFNEGKRIHAEILGGGCEVDIFVENTLISMYAQCRSITDACQVFNKMEVRDVITWNTMITGYVQEGNTKEAFRCFEEMQQDGMKFNKVTFICLLVACSDLLAFDQGKWLHCNILKLGCEGDDVVSCSLVDMYGKCGSIRDARRAFDRICVKKLVSWNVMISGYVFHEDTKEALALFECMWQQDAKPDVVTYISILNACANGYVLHQGRKVHAHVVKAGHKSDTINNTIIDLYMKCGSIIYAHEAFEKMPIRDVFTWTTMLTGYVSCGYGKEAFKFYLEMQDNEVAFTTILGSCVGDNALGRGKYVHATIVTSRCQLDVIVFNALVDMYLKCGDLHAACYVFNRMLVLNVVMWTALISGCSHLLDNEMECLKLFDLMQHEGVLPNNLTLLSVLYGCASLGALQQAKCIIASILKGEEQSGLFVGSSLIDTYIKCGNLEDACLLFDKKVLRDDAMWNAIIGGHAQHGDGRKAILLFCKMQEEGIMPDDVTFISILSACSHACLLDEGNFYLVTMARNCGIIPAVDHYSCMTDLFGRAGLLDEAEEIMDHMPYEPTVSMWMSLLGSSRIYCRKGLAERAMEKVLELEPSNAAAVILLANIYARILG